MTINVRGWPVMKSQCSTCPFKVDPDLAQKVLDRTLFQTSQICHHPVLHGKKQNRLCRGQRDIQLKLLHAIGLLPEPTDAAFKKRSEELGVV